MDAVVIVIIILIICIQLFFFIKNFLRMRQFSQIFKEQHSWQLTRNFETSFVNGVSGDGNTIFASIIVSIH